MFSILTKKLLKSNMQLRSNPVNRLLASSYSRQLVSVISDQKGLPKELYYDDVRASPFCAKTTIHDEDVLSLKLQEPNRKHLIESRKRLHQPFQLFQDLVEEENGEQADIELTLEVTQCS